MPVKPAAAGPPHTPKSSAHSLSSLFYKVIGTGANLSPSHEQQEQLVGFI